MSTESAPAEARDFPESIYLPPYEKSKDPLIVLGFLASVPGVIVGITVLSSPEPHEPTFPIVVPGFYFLFFLGIAYFALRMRWERRRFERIYRRGEEVEAEIVSRSERGARWSLADMVAISANVHRLLSGMFQLELRYRCGDREVVSRRKVTSMVYYRTRGWATLPVRVLPEDPYRWVPVIRPNAEAPRR